MGVALGGSGLTPPEHLADEVEAVAARYGDRGEEMPRGRFDDAVGGGIFVRQCSPIFGLLG
jgi:hypothetical protein